MDLQWLWIWNGDDNYRPISLLNSLYKLYAIIIKSRLTEGLELILGALQFGFRTRHSTTQPIFCLRRIIAYLERGDGDGLILLIDWEKAFDKIYQSRIWETMARYGVPDALINATRSLYAHATFAVHLNGVTSGTYRQERGIRQGCPLSPFLFIVVMAAIMEDTLTLLRTHGEDDPDWIFQLSHLLYTDDTALLASSTPKMSTLLNALETVAARYGLRLNHAKCVWLASGLHLPLAFRDGTPIQRVNEATYLGSHLNIFSDQLKEIHKRLMDARLTWQKLGVFWKRSVCPTRVKLRIFDAVIRAKILYSTPSMWLSQGDCTKLDAFMYKTLRQILKVQSTFKDRTKTNHFLLTEANRRLNIGNTRHLWKKTNPCERAWEKTQIFLAQTRHQGRRDRPYAQSLFHRQHHYSGGTQQEKSRPAQIPLDPPGTPGTI